MAKSLKLIVEALLFASDKPLTIKEIHAVLPDAKPAEIAGALRVLKYEHEAMGRSFALHEVGGGFQFRSRPEYGAYILKMLQASPARLSRATMETLAVIAYKQPVLRQEIERLRGVDVGGILKTLLEKGLVKIMGRKNLPGRPLVYGTTRKFLEVFDLKDIESLPKIKELKALGSEDDEQQSLFDQKSDQEEISADEAPPQEEPTTESAG
jgi:segregation and condensation protein B